MNRDAPSSVAAAVAAALRVAALLTVSSGAIAAAAPPPIPPSPPPAPPTAPSSPSRTPADAAPAPPTPASPPGDDAPTPGRTLDDLLGLSRPGAAERDEPRADEAAPDDAGAAPSDGDRSRLDRALREEELEDAFEQAVELMRQSMDRLGARADSSIDTQRIQEEAVRRLDSIIDAARKRRQQQQQSQQSQSRDRNQQDQGEPRPQDGEPQMQPTSRRDRSASQRPERSAQPGVAEPPGLQEGELDEVMHEGRVEWGRLPERVRDLVQQSRRDRVSSLYLRLTEEYYRRMAEEASR